MAIQSVARSHRRSAFKNFLSPSLTMADKNAEENGYRPVTVEQRGRFTVITGDDRDPHFQQVTEEVTNNFIMANSPAQHLQLGMGSTSEPQSSPNFNNPSLSETQSLSARQPQNASSFHHFFPPSPNPSLDSLLSPQTRSGSESQHHPVPDSNGDLPSLASSRGGSGFGFDIRSGFRLSRSGPPFASLSMAFFSPQPQQTPFPQLQTPQFQFQPPQQQLQFPQMQAQFQVPQPQLLLYTKEKVPAGWSTKFEDLHQESQNVLLQIEYVICLVFVSLIFLLLMCMVLGFRVLGQTLVSLAFPFLFHSLKALSIPVRKDC